MDSSAARPGRPSRRWGALAGFVAGFVAALAAAVIVVWALFWRSGIRLDLSRPTVVQHIQQLQRLETVVYSMEKIVSGSQESRYLPRLLAGDRLLLIVHGEVTAGVDLARLDGSAVRISGRSIALDLPAAEARLLVAEEWALPDPHLSDRARQPLAHLERAS